MKSFGNFVVIRFFFKMIMIFLGGTFSEILSIHFVYAVTSIYSCIFLVFVLFFFEEVKQKQVWVGFRKLWSNITEFMKILIKPRILLPFFMMILVSVSPSLFDTSKYVMLNLGKQIKAMEGSDSLAGWRVFDLSLNQLLYGLSFAAGFFFYLNYIPAQRYDYTMLIGLISWSFMLFFQMMLPLITSATPFWLVFAIRYVQLLFGNISGEFILSTMVGKVSKDLPKGFESFGVVFVVSCANMCGNIANMGDIWEIKKFNIKRGYYLIPRLGYAAMLNYGYSIFLVLISSFFLRWKK